MHAYIHTYIHTYMHAYPTAISRVFLAENNFFITLEILLENESLKHFQSILNNFELKKNKTDPCSEGYIGKMLR